MFEIRCMNACSNERLVTQKRMREFFPQVLQLFRANVPVNSKTAHPLPGQTPGHLTFLKNFGQIPRYVAVLTVKCPTR